jgi:hypothetical protein
LAAIAAIAGAAETAMSDCSPSYTGGSITITGGTLNGETISPDFPEVFMLPGDPLEGTVDIHVVNNGGSGDVFPVCATTSWGDHMTSGWTIDPWLHNPPGTGDYTVPISVTGPLAEGTCYIFFAASWEMNCGNVLSCTNWANGTGDVWNDGYDVADWTDLQAQSAIDSGWVCSKWLAGGSLHDFNIPAAALRVFVSTSVEATKWGDIKQLYE